MDWTRLSPREVFDAVKNAPLVAGPWEEATVDAGGVQRGYPCRKTPQGHDLVWECAGKVTIHAWAFRVAMDFPSREAADTFLRDEGWILVLGRHTP